MIAQDNEFHVDFLVGKSGHRVVSMPAYGFSHSVVPWGFLMNLLRRVWRPFHTNPTGHSVPNRKAAIAYTLATYVTGSKWGTMTDRISEEVVSIVEVEYEPQMDRAKIQGTLKMDDGKWKFRTKLDHIKPGDVLRVIVERTEDEDGKYLRIHEIIEERKQRYV